MDKYLFIIFIAKTIDNFASRGWIYEHFKDCVSDRYVIEIFENDPIIDKGHSLELYIKSKNSEYKTIFLITTNTDNHNGYVNWENIKKYVFKVILFPIDAISVLPKFKKSIKEYVDLVWCPHIKVLNKLKEFNKEYIYMPYASKLPERIKAFNQRNNEIFFQGTAHGLRKSLIIEFANKSNSKINVQGNGWDNLYKKNKFNTNSIEQSLNYYFGDLSETFNKIFKTAFENKYFFKSFLNYPKRILKENISLKKNNLIQIPTNKKTNIDQYKYSLGINFLFSNKNEFSYRLRDFECPAHGSCHFTHYDQNLEKIFLPNISMLYYKDEKELIELTDFYINTKEGQQKAREISINARKVAKSNTWNSRFDDILKYFKK
tara:strand:- start:1466 stop:2590 length:1125 start_codon:yes stop_codon:yes gene_type:complete